MYIRKTPNNSNLVNELRDRRNQNRINRNEKEPSRAYPIDYIVSQYPLKFAQVGNVLNGFAAGTFNVFPNSKYIGYSTFEYSTGKNQTAFKQFVESETERKYPNAVSIPNLRPGSFIFADIILMKAKFKQEKLTIFGKDRSYPKLSQQIKNFVNLLKYSKTRDFIIEVDIPSNLKPNDIVKTVSDNTKSNVYAQIINACEFTGQNDTRLFITSFPMLPELKNGMVESFVSNLDPANVAHQHLVSLQQAKMQYYKDGKMRKDSGYHTMTGNIGKSGNEHPVQCANRMSTNPIMRPYLLEDWRLNSDAPILRKFSLGELERLAGFPTGWIYDASSPERGKALRTATNPIIVQYLMSCYAIYKSDLFGAGVMHG